MNRRDFLARSLGLVAGSAVLPGLGTFDSFAKDSSRPAAPGKPNIVMILADDLGYADIGVNGCKDVPTPNIDSIAANGIRFTSGYVSCPVCSPTRAGLMTGRYQQRFGHEFNPGPAASAPSNFGLPLTETTLADRLKAQGYATGMFGKWHLGYSPDYHPMKRGFDEFYGFLGGSHSYVNATGDKTNPILRGTEPVESVKYTTEAFATEAISFIERHAGSPFFVYLPFNAIHNPQEAPEEYLKRFEQIADPTRRKMAAMLSAMDDAIGRVLSTLTAKGAMENTLIFFVSDNGGPTAVNGSLNAPFSGFKGQVLEGGIHVPYLMQWKARIPGGKTIDAPVISLDVHATAIVAAGISPAPEWKLDGVDLVPFIEGKQKSAPHDALYWRYGEQAAMRRDDWKLRMMGGGSAALLFNLADDPGEKKDLSADRKEKMAELMDAWKAWNTTLKEPLWKNGTGGGRMKKNGRGGAGKRKKERDQISQPAPPKP